MRSLLLLLYLLLVDCAKSKGQTNEYITFNSESFNLKKSNNYCYFNNV